MKWIVKELAGFLGAMVFIYFLLNARYKEIPVRSLESILQDVKTKVLILKPSSKDTVFSLQEWVNTKVKMVNEFIDLPEDTGVNRLYAYLYAYNWFLWFKKLEKNKQKILLRQPIEWKRSLKDHTIGPKDPFLARAYSQFYPGRPHYLRYNIPVPPGIDSFFTNNAHFSCRNTPITCLYRFSKTYFAYDGDSTQGPLVAWIIGKHIKENELAGIEIEYQKAFSRAFKREIKTGRDSLILLTAYFSPIWFIDNKRAERAFLKHTKTITFEPVSLELSKKELRHFVYMMEPELMHSLLHNAIESGINNRWGPFVVTIILLIFVLPLLLPYSVLVVVHMYERKKILLTLLLLTLAVLPPFFLPEVAGSLFGESIFTRLLLYTGAVLANGITFQIIIYTVELFIREREKLYFLFLKQVKKEEETFDLLKGFLLYVKFMFADLFRKQLISPPMIRYTFSALNFKILHVILKYSIFIIDSILLMGVLAAHKANLTNLTAIELIFDGVTKKGSSGYPEIFAGMFFILLTLFFLKIFLLLFKYMLYPDLVKEVE